MLADAGLRLKLSEEAVPEPHSRGWSRLTGTQRARAAVQPGSRLTVLAEAGEHSAELEVLIVRHHAKRVGPRDRAQGRGRPGEARFDPESGVVTVFEGRPEFRALARAARRAGLPKRRVQEYVPYRMLEVEAAGNAVYQWAAERLLERRRRAPARSGRVRARGALRATRAAPSRHARLMRAFLDPEVFDGAVRLDAEALGGAQGSLLGEKARDRAEWTEMSTAAGG